MPVPLSDWCRVLIETLRVVQLTFKIRGPSAELRTYKFYALACCINIRSERPLEHGASSFAGNIALNPIDRETVEKE